MAGYSGTPLPRKLGLKPQFRIAFFQIPGDVKTTLKDSLSGCQLIKDVRAELDFAMPEIPLLKNKKEIATVWNHEGTAIGSSVWNGDWYNGDPDRWLRWFDARGMKGARAFFDQAHREERGRRRTSGAG